MFHKAVEATKTLCQYNSATNTYGIPSLALKIGHTLKKCAMIKTNVTVCDGQTDLAKGCQEFRSLCKDEWSDLISSGALLRLNTAKMNKGQSLPLTEDIEKLQTFLKDQSKIIKLNMETVISKSSWDKLNSITLTQLVMFNRKRGGEVERIRK